MKQVRQDLDTIVLNGQVFNLVYETKACFDTGWYINPTERKIGIVNINRLDDTKHPKIREIIEEIKQEYNIN